jgi:parvulin-like peptidyl-prolyl isomerase
MKKDHSSNKKKKINHTKHTKKEKFQNPPTLIMSILAVLIVIVVLVLVFQEKLFSKTEVDNSEKEVVVATVNGKEIYKSLIDKQYNLLPDYMKQQIEINLILNKTIEEEVLIEIANSKGIKVTDSEVKALIDTLMYQNGITEEILEKQLELNKMTRTELNEVYREQIRITKLFNESVLSKIVVSDDEAFEFYDNNKETSTIINIPETIKASHILVDTKKEAQEILDLIKDNESFYSLAQKRSKDSGSASLGGDLGFFPRGVMIKPFEDTAFSMDIEDEPRIVETDFGFHIIDVTAKKEAYSKEYEEVKEIIKQTLLVEKQQKAIVEYIQQKKDEAEIIIYWDNLYEGSSDNLPEGVSTFTDTGEDICRTEDSKPIVRMYTTTTCPYCTWASPIIDPILEERMAKGEIYAEHWYLDKQDNILTPENEGRVSKEALEHMMKYNSNGFVPFYSVGCKYIRIGNGHSGEINAEVFERNEFNAVIDAVVNPVKITIN